MKTRITRAKLLKLPLEFNSSNTLLFDTKEAQENYFNSLENIEETNFSYVREDGTLRYPIDYDEAIKYNYVMYQNSEYTDKWFYAFISDYKYANDNMTLLKLEDDSIQSYMFDIEFKECFIEREHVNDDTIGNNTVPENLETGEHIINNEEQGWRFIGNDILVQVSELADGTRYIGNLINGMYTGLILCAFKNSDAGIKALGDFIGEYIEKGKENAIVNIFMFPDIAIPNFGADAISKIITSANSNVPPYTASIDYTYRGVLGGYAPKNNKLFTYPYNYLILSNNMGANNILKREYFHDKYKAVFNIEGAICPGGSFIMWPNYYKNGNALNDAIVFGKFPTCAWAGDPYKIWLAQNSLNVGVNVGAGLAEIGIGALSTPINPVLGVGTILKGVTGIMSNLATVAGKSSIPASASGNTNAGDAMFSAGWTNYTIYEMSVKYEFAQIIDDYFTAYGYKVNRIKVPNIRGRKNVNFVKTVGGCVHGFIPSKDIKNIENMLDNGIAFWHNKNTYMNYKADNSIL